LVRTIRIGKKYAIYLPKTIVDRLGLHEGDRLIVEIGKDKIIFRTLPRLLKERRYWSETTVDEFEEESKELLDAAEEG